MTETQIIQLVLQVGVIPALFIWLLMYVMNEHKKDKEDSRKREDSLMDHIRKSDDTQSAIMLSIGQISTSQQGMQTNMALMQRDIEALKRKEGD